MNLLDTRNHIDLFHGAPLSVLSDCIRGFLIAKPGHDLIACDFSAIEARVLAWLAGEEKVLEIFRRGLDVYCHEASPIFGRAITKDDKDERQVGKVSILALGFGGGIGAFATMAKTYGIDLDAVYALLKRTFTELELEKADYAYASYKKHASNPVSYEAGVVSDIIKQRWRRKNQTIVKYWAALEDDDPDGLEDAAKAAILNPEKKYAAGPRGREVTYLVKGSFLWCRLPSGRVLCYPYPRVENLPTRWDTNKDTITFMGVDSYTNKWERQTTYGGSLSENVTQAVARDLLADAMAELERRDYPIVMHVHDEAVVEVAEGFGSLQEVEQVMSTPPAWAAGLPMAAEGWRGKRYRK